MDIKNWSINDYADFWYHEVGVNVIPADTRNKKPIVQWQQFQNKPIPKELFHYWKKENMFKDGMMIIVGKVWHNERKKNIFLNCIDLDNNLAIKEICTINGEQKTLKELADTGHFLVEHHPDDPARAHVFVWSTKPFKKKTSTVLSITGDTNVPRIEIKGEGNDSLVSVTPSPHANGSNYEFIGDWNLAVMEPKTHDEIKNHINTLCESYGIYYLTDANNNNTGTVNLRLRPSGKKIPVGERHNTILRYTDSILRLLYKTTPLEIVKETVKIYNKSECEIPLSDSEIDQIWNDAAKYIGKQVHVEEQEQEKDKDKDKPMSVLEAKRIHNGTITVIGTIVSVSDMYIVALDSLVNGVTQSVDRNAKSIQLEDTENLDENEKLDIILFDEMINRVIAGEVIEVTGNMCVVDKRGNSKSKKKINILNATSIKYVNKKEFVITKKDIADFDNFVSYPEPIKRLTAMFAPNIIGHNDVKRGLLRSIVGGINRGKKGGGRVDTLMVGDMGTAKSKLAAEATEIKPNSRHVSAPHATTKTITAIPEKINDSVVIIYGAIPLSKNAICAIDEITSFPIEDQSRLLSVLEEGKINLDKLGVRSVIDSPTTIIATANPIQTKWSNPQRISIEEIDLKRNLLDRFAQIYGFRDEMEEEQTQLFVSEMDKISQRPPHNYNFLRKYLIHASSIKDVKFTKEARQMLNQFWAKGKLKGLLTNRMFYGLYKIAEAHAKLQLKEIVDVEIAEQVLVDVRLMMVQYDETVEKILDPREITYNTCLDVLKKSESPITIEVMCQKAIEQNQQITYYLGYTWNIQSNHKLRQVIDSLLNHPCVKKVGSKPIVLQWLSDTSDTSDAKNKDINQNNELSNIQNDNNLKQESMSDTSDTSDRIDYLQNGSHS
jgi:MoxR-like ATPase